MTAVQQALEKIATLKHMGLKVLEESPNTLKVEMPYEGNSNHLGGVYAGAIFTLAEFPFGVMCINKFDMKNIVPVVGEVTIRFIAPSNGSLTVEVNVSDDQWAEIERETKAKGKFKLIKEIEVRDQQGKLISVAKATYFTLAVNGA